jgi:hypothetical protein
VDDAFTFAVYCHCSICRRATGAACKPLAGIERSKLRITAGQDDILVLPIKDWHDERCGRCYSLLYAVVRNGTFVHVLMGTLMDTPSIRPSAHIFVGSKAEWYEITDHLPQYEEHMPEAGQ